MEEVEDQVLQALDAEERATLWRLLARALHDLDGADDLHGAGAGTEPGAPALTPTAP